MHRVLALLSFAPTVFAQEGYQKPSKEIQDVLNAPAPARGFLSPDRTHLLLFEPSLYPPVSDLAKPMLRIAGLRINPGNNAPHRFTYARTLALQPIAGGAEIHIALSASARPGLPKWSPDGRQFAFLNTTATSVELWIGDAATGGLRRVYSGVDSVMTSAGDDPVFAWMPDSRALLVQTIPSDRGKPPTASDAPPGPHAQQSEGRAGPVRTYEDMLANPHDEVLFDYYATAQLMRIDAATGHGTPIGKPGIFETVEISPDGKQLLIARVHKPYSYLHPFEAFPKEVEVWNLAGQVTHKLASLPLEDSVPIEGVPTGPREYHWRATDPATLIWVEALDNGDPRTKAPFRDHVLLLSSPFTAPVLEILRTEQRLVSYAFSEKGPMLVADYDRDRRWTRMFLTDPHLPGERKLLWDLSVQDRYNNPGTPLEKMLPNGHMAFAQDGMAIFLHGPGATPQGDRPVLRKMDLTNGVSVELFRSNADSYEIPEELLNDSGTKVLTRSESPADPPNYFVRTLGNGPSKVQLTHYSDPTPLLRGVTKQIVTYKREDGVPLSFTLYLPPDYQPGKRLPTVVWAYPYEFNDASTAGQISGSAKRFTTILGASQLFFALCGYAVLDNAAMPVIGTPEKVNDTYLDQIVMDAQAAIDKAVEMGVTDRNRVGVGGHSYGAFMTANLLAHCNLFRAGIARSGAYNRTLTPFGFQSERRTLWEAPNVYVKLSPFMNANKIKAPLLLIHGEADDNQGTFPIQSERMYAAVRGNGGTVRLVTLPYEAHGYLGRESIEHTLFEMISWFDKYVKNATGEIQSTE